MEPNASRNDRRWVVFLLGCLLVNPPVLSLFAQPAGILEIPLLYAYLYLAWAGLIALIALVSRESPPDRGGGP